MSVTIGGANVRILCEPLTFLLGILVSCILTGICLGYDYMGSILIHDDTLFGSRRNIAKKRYFSQSVMSSGDMHLSLNLTSGKKKDA